MHQARRDLGVKYKDVSAPPLKEYIYDVNMGRYQDPLRPSFEYLVGKYNGDYHKIISASTRPNPDINRLLAGFKDWMAGQDEMLLRKHEDWLINIILNGGS